MTRHTDPKHASPDSPPGSLPDSPLGLPPGSKPTSIDRRTFLKTGTLAGAAALAGATDVSRAQSADSAASDEGATTPVMTAQAEAAPPADVQVMDAGERAGSDYMVDIFKSLDFEYFCANPGSSFRGLHESVINYGGNTSPELITCLHEESSVAMAHGYFKAEGKPLAIMAHGTVGLQHAAMAIYNAWCDRVPVYVILGNHDDAALRRGAEWYHGVQDAAHMVRLALTDSGPVRYTLKTPYRGGTLRVIASIEEPQVIERILEHLARDEESLDPAHPSLAPPQARLSI